ncbi:MAG: ABC transporter permease [Gammaproteobacteria bacterium]|nr:ABC transporter permease [Gammaproteobacteria bacterium]
MQLLIPRLQSWWLLWMATVITMAIVAASQLFTDRISLLLDRQATELLAADLMINSNHALPDNLRQQARELGLQTAEVVELRTAVFIDDEPQLVELKAVSSAYPLRGRLEKKKERLSEVITSERGPEPGEIWIDIKLADQMEQALEIGFQRLSANWILHFEPDRGGSLFNLAPRIMMHMDDLAATGLLVEGSRARYKLLVAGDVAAVADFKALIEPRLAESEKLQTIENARPEMRSALERTRMFFAMSIVLTLVIAMVAIAITARYATSRESTKVAVMRSFGISSRRLMRYYLMQFGKVWLLAVPAGLLGGMLAQFPLQWMLGFWFDSRLPDASATPYLLATVVGFVSLMGFSLPPLLRLIDIPPLQVLRPGSRRQTRAKFLGQTLISLLTLFVILLLIVPNMQLASWLFVAILATATFIPLVLKLILHGLNRIGPSRFWLKNYVLSRLLSQSRNALYVMSGFSLTLLSVLLISQVKDQLLMEWERQLPLDKPNYFLVNIPTQDVEALTRFLSDNAIPASEAYALVRARLTSINQQPLDQIEFDNERAYRMANHTFNISYTDQLPFENEIVQGQWLTASDDMQQFSVEEGLANDLGLGLGDRLEFDLAGSRFSATISSIRSVVWENFQPNFFIIGTREQLAQQPQTWLLSTYISEQNRPLLKPLLQLSPSVTLLDISELMQRVKQIINRASQALEFFFVFATLAAIIVLLSALNSANRERELEIALLQALGASRQHKRWSQVFEFVLMGLLVGFFAALFANLIGSVVAQRFFDLSFGFVPHLWISSIVSAILLITLVGSLFIYRSFSISPIRLLRS